MTKQKFKIITPIERKDGTKFWMRLGSGYRNKDDSINCYLDAVPVGQRELVIQIRELTEEDLRASEHRRNGASAVHTNPPLPSAATADVPF